MGPTVLLPQGLADGGSLSDVELATESLVTPGHDLHIGAEEEAVPLST